jgi:molecular chaperone GrpE
MVTRRKTEDMSNPGPGQARESMATDRDERNAQSGVDAGGGALEALPEAEVLLAELEEARIETAELKDRHLRLAAEFDNFRRRTRQEQLQLRALAQADIARSVLPTLDDLARWRDIPNESTSVEALDQGLDLILRNLAKALEEHGVQRIDAENEVFDPEWHQALMTSEASQPDEDQTISRVFLNGYRIGDLLVRPAQVEVRNWEGPVESAAESAESEEDQEQAPTDGDSVPR